MPGSTQPAEDPPARSGHTSLDVRIASNRCAHRVARPGVTLHLIRWIATVHVPDLRRILTTADLFATLGQRLARLLAFRALLRCFLPGGPPELPFGVLESPGRFNFAINEG